MFKTFDDLTGMIARTGQAKLGQDEHQISLKQASMLSGYATDYLGWLIRQNKLNGQKIGRDWFTTNKALESYLKQGKAKAGAPNSLKQQKRLNTLKIRLPVQSYQFNRQWVITTVILFFILVVIPTMRLAVFLQEGTAATTTMDPFITISTQEVSLVDEPEQTVSNFIKFVPGR